MVIHVKDEKTDWLVREFARRRGIGITDAIKTAIEEALENEAEGLAFAQERLEPLLAKVREAKKLNYRQAAQATDEMWEDM